MSGAVSAWIESALVEIEVIGVVEDGKLLM